MSASAERSVVESFEAHRSALTGLAYRMLGSRAEAEDVVQDAYLRWHAVDPPRSNSRVATSAGSDEVVSIG